MSRRLGIPVFTKTCAYCGFRNSIGVEPEERMPICLSCSRGRGLIEDPIEGEDESDEDTARAGWFGSSTILERVLVVLERCAGVTMPELYDLLDASDDLTRRTIKQTVSRLVSKGLVHADGPRGHRTYFAIAQSEHDDDSRAETLRADTTEPAMMAAL